MISAVRPPLLVRKYYSDLTWRIPTELKEVYLTFDDGPIPGVTEFVLDQLERFDVKATFFCIGDNVQKHPDVFQKIEKAEHRIGNHTFHHVNGWKVNTASYLENVKLAETYIQSPLFRPPYGKIRKAQAKGILEKYRIIMWDVLSYDFDSSITPQQCFRNVKNNTRPGSIIVFHDSVKAEKNLRLALPQTLSFLKQEGYSFRLF